MAETRYDAVIVGAGLAGLTAAWELRDRHILVLEAADRVGGRLLSEPRGRYWLNLGAHLFGGAGSRVGRLVEEVGLETRLIPGNRMALATKGKILATGRPETYPLRLPLSPAARLSFIRAGLRAGRRLLQVTDAQIEEALVRDLHAVLPDTRGIVREVRIQRWEKAIPFAPPGRRLLQPGLERPLGNIFLAGDYLEFAEMEVAAETGQEAAHAARRRLDGGA